MDRHTAKQAGSASKLVKTYLLSLTFFIIYEYISFRYSRTAWFLIKKCK